jgi:hypothetical protein
LSAAVARAAAIITIALVAVRITRSATPVIHAARSARRPFARCEVTAG